MINYFSSLFILAFLTLAFAQTDQEVCIRALRGQPGPPGQNDPREITELKRLLQIQNERITALEQRIDSCCNDTLVYGQHRIRLAYTRGVGVDYNEALRICNGNLAEIESDDMYRVVYDYILRNWEGYTNHPNWNFVEVWLGSSYQPANNPDGQITLINGALITLSEWLPDWPHPHPSRVNMVIRVVTKGTSNLKGVANIFPLYTVPVPLCRYN